MSRKYSILLAVGLLIVLVLTGDSLYRTPAASSTLEPKEVQLIDSILDQAKQTDHFMIHYPADDSISADYVGTVLEDHLERICADLAHSPQQQIDVYIYPDLELFHKAIDYPDAPEWVVATGWNDMIQMVSPRLISGYFIEKVIVHELVHVLHGQINPDAPFWMVEGLAMYEAGQSETVAETVRNGIQSNHLPALTSFETLKSEEDFVNAGGYDYAYSIVEFAVQTYGKAILAGWVKTPRDYERVFGISLNTFEKQWQEWLVESYS